MSRSRALPPAVKAQRAIERALAPLGDDDRAKALCLVFGPDAEGRAARYRMALEVLERIGASKNETKDWPYWLVRETARKALER